MKKEKLANLSTEYLNEILILCDNNNEQVAGVMAADIALLVSVHKIDLNCIIDAFALAIEHLELEGIIKGVNISPISTTLQ